MSLESTLAFTAAFFLLACSPGPGLAAILSRSLSTGISAGFAVTAGLVLGDAVFMVTAMLGLSAVATALGPLFEVVKYCGSFYLIYLGIRTLRAPASAFTIKADVPAPLYKDFGLGLLVTLGNPKPILFYGALLPSFLDIRTASILDFALLMGIVTSVSLLVYGFYIFLTVSGRKFLVSSQLGRRIQKVTGLTLIGSGVGIASR